MSTPSKTPSWADISSQLDPLMPQEQYDALRQRYYYSVVVPTLSPRSNVTAAWEDFKTKTERPSMLSESEKTLLHAGVMAGTFKDELMKPLGPLKGASPQLAKELDDTHSNLAAMKAIADREGLHTGLGEFAGSSLAMATQWEALAPLVGPIAEGVAGAALKAGRAQEFMTRVARGSLTFGTLNALSEQNGHRLMGGLHGMMVGAAWETALSPFMKAGFSKDEAQKLVTSAVRGQKPVMPEADVVVAKTLADDAETARVNMIPRSITEDPAAKGLEVRGFLKDGKTPIIFRVAPYKESLAVDQMKKLVGDGGSIEGIHYSPEHQTRATQFLKTLSDMTESKLDNVQRVKLEAPVDSPEITKVGSRETVVNLPQRPDFSKPDVVLTEISKRVPQAARSTDVFEDWSRNQASIIPKFYDPRYPESWRHNNLLNVRAEFVDMLPDRYKTAWEDAAKAQPGAVSEGQIIPGFKYEYSGEQRLKIPEQSVEEWHQEQELGFAAFRETQQPGVRKGSVIEYEDRANWQKTRGTITDIRVNKNRYPNDPTDPEVHVTVTNENGTINILDRNELKSLRVLGSEAEQARLEEIAEKERTGQPTATANQRKQAREIAERTGQEYPGPKFTIPLSEAARFSQMALQERPGQYHLILPPELAQRLGIEAPGFTFSNLMDGANWLKEKGLQISFDTQGFNPIKSLVVLTQKDKGTVFHEMLHVGLNRGGIEIPDVAIPEHKPTLAMIAAKLGEMHPEYYGAKVQPFATRIEEAYVHAAEAVRMGDMDKLGMLARWDTSIDHVLNMVQDTSLLVADEAMSQADSYPLRKLIRQTEDLARRASYDRSYHLRQLLNFTGEMAHYDPENDIIRAVGSGGESKVFKTFDSLWDYMHDNDVQLHGPSASYALELQGVRGPIFPAGTRFSSKLDTDPIEPVGQEPWVPLQTLTAWTRPMLTWAGDLQGKIDAILSRRGHAEQFDLYGPIRQTDEQFRNGYTWANNARESFAGLVKGIGSKKAEAYFNMLVYEPRFWPQMLDKLKLTQEDGGKVVQLNEWFENFRNDTHIDPFSWLRDQYPRLRGFNFEQEFFWGPELRDPKGVGFWQQKVRYEKAWNPQEQNLGKFANFLINEGFQKKFTGESLDALQHTIDRMVDVPGKGKQFFLPQLIRWPLQNYINYMKGQPDMSQRLLNASIKAFQEGLETQFKRLNKFLPEGAQLPEKLAWPQTVFNRMIVLSYAAGLGLRPAIMMRDGLQALVTTLPVLGPKKFLMGFNDIFKGGYDIAEKEGALLGRHNIGELYGDVIDEIPKGSKFDKLVDVSNKLLQPSRWGHNFGRAIAYRAEYLTALPLIEKYRAGLITPDTLINETSAWFADKAAQSRLLKIAEDIEHELVDTNGIKKSMGTSSHEAARQFAFELNDLTQWPYRRGTQPGFLRTGAGRIFGQYGMWPLNYFDFLTRLTKRGLDPAHRTQALQTAATWLAMNTAAFQTFEHLGADTGKWWFFSPATPMPVGSPHWQFVQALGQSMEDTPEGREARRTVLQYPLNFVPAFAEMRSIIKAVGDGDITATDMSGPGLLRTLGMRPLPAIEQDKEWDDWVKFQMGFQEPPPR